MNRTYRLVWNCALRVVQVASERAVHSRVGSVRSERSRRIAPATLALAVSVGLFSLAPPSARADTGTAHGGTGTSAGQGSGGPVAAGNGGSAGINGPTAGTGYQAGAAATSPGGNGGDAGTGSSSSVGAGGGGGGANGGTALGSSPLKGGNGGMGSGSSGYSGGGGGGGGGYGVVLSGVSGNLTGTFALTGGSGGAGGYPASVGSGAFGGGGGGGGGDGAYLSTATAGTALTLQAAVTGGAGGVGGNSGGGGWNTTAGGGGDSSGQGGAATVGYNGSGGGSGGGGGAGLSFNSSAAGVTMVTNATTIAGGAGGDGGSDRGANGRGGNGGQGGVGVDIAGSLVRLINAGTIRGGDGGQAGQCLNYCSGGAGSAGLGNAGVIVRGDDTILNRGSIRGGMDGNGGSRAHAVDLSGGGNTLVLENGYAFGGHVVSSSGSTGGGDTLVLGGDRVADGGSGDGSFDVSAILGYPPSGYTSATRYYGFASYRKTGSSTWTLTGTDGIGIDWTIAAGTLVGDSNSLRGATLTDDAALVFDQSAAGTYAGQVVGSGSVTKTGSGTLILTGANTYTGGTAIEAGTLQIGAGGTTGSIVGDVVDDGELAFDRSDATTFSGVLSGGGVLKQLGSGTLVLDGDNSAFAGQTTVQAGGLIVGGAAGSGAVLGGDVSVEGGATLGGHGRIGGDVSLAAGAHLSPGHSIGTLTIDGSASFAQGSVLDFEFGAPGADFATFGSGDSVSVGGDLTLDGATLDVTDAGTMGPGLYKLFTWGGSLSESNGGLTLNNLSGQTVQLQTLSAQRQINLIDTSGLTLNFWNANGQASATQMGGGSGTWSTTAQAWTDATGSVPNASMQPQPGFAIFAGSPGTVAVNDATGAVQATGLQFAADGYTLAGDTLTLVADSSGMPTIRVGDGSADSAGMRAVVAVALAGSDGLLKSDAGTLVLAGANTYTGGTHIAAGTLQVGDGGHDGAILGDVQNDATLAFDRSDAVHFDGAIGGSGALVQKGAGTLILTGANTYTGGTRIAAGTLQVGDGGHGGAILGDVQNDGTLAFDRSDAVHFDGAIGGSGALVQKGAGTLVLTGTNTYTGGTRIAAGTLQVGDGGHGGAILGDVQNDGTLAFDRSDAVHFDGAIGGSGALVQKGTGTLVLTGANTYTGGTRIEAGTLRGDTASLQGAIANHAALVFDQGSDGVFAGILAGDGQLTKAGAGTLVLDAAHTFSGTTTVQAGTLIVGDDGHPGATLGGAVTVAAGATLGGTGTIGALDLSGTLAPGNSPGTLHVTGDARIAKGATYRIDVVPDGSGDALAVGGRLSILGGSAVAIDAAGDWKPETGYIIASAGGGIDGHFDSVQSSLAFLDPTLAYETDAVRLTLVRNDVAFGDVAVTRNQRATAAAIDAVGAAGPLYDDLVTLDAAGARAAFDGLSGEIHADLKRAWLEDGRFVREAIDQRLRQDGDTPGQAAWAESWGHWGDVDGDGNAARQRGNGSGLVVGIDTAAGDRARIGAIIGDSQASLDAAARASSAHLRSTWLGAYAGWNMPALDLRLGLAHAWTDLRATRRVRLSGPLQTLQSGGRGRAMQAFVEVARPIVVGRGRIEPYLNLAGIRVHAGAYAEHGGDAALQVRSGDAQLGSGALGVRGRWVPVSGGFDLQAGLGWRHAFGAAVDPTAIVRLDSGPAFRVQAPPIARDAAMLAFDLRFDIGRQAQVQVGYDGQFAGHERDQGARMRLTWSF